MAAPRPGPLNARDLVRGYRLDIWSARVGAVAVAAPARTAPTGSAATARSHSTVTDEEGFTQLAVVQPADDPTRRDDSVADRGGRAAAGHRPVRERAGRAVERLEPVRAAAGPRR